MNDLRDFTNINKHLHKKNIILLILVFLKSVGMYDNLLFDCKITVREYWIRGSTWCLAEN